jgi:hypothetical protein
MGTKSIDQIVLNAGFQKLTKTELAEYWIIPISGRLLAFTDDKVIADMVTDKGGVALPKSAEIIDIVHSLNWQEHDTINKLL